MKSLVFDIEANDIDATKIWCLAAVDVDTNQQYSYGPSQLDEAWELLKSYDRLIGHNIIGYDIPVIKKLAGVDLSDKTVLDTLVLSRLFNPVREGNHGLESWGYRLNTPKGDFEDFDSFSTEMLDYCERDVLLNAKVFHALRQEAKGFSKKSVALETEVAHILHEQRERGFLFDVEAASKLLAKLQERLSQVEADVQEDFKSKIEVINIYPFRTKTGSISKMGCVSPEKKVRLTDEEYQQFQEGTKVIVRTNEKEFNLGSRKQIGEYLQEYGWVPEKFTPTGQPIVDEGILNKIKDIPQAQMIAEYLMLQKRIAQINSWFKNLKEDNRVHGFVNPNGTITGRMTHRDPNLAQVPSTKSTYGSECRACWIVPDGYKLVGIDASGLELRMLAHYIDSEDFTNEILDGDIHTSNQKVAKLESRNQAKHCIYAIIYGAGDLKLGQVVGGSARDGKRIRQSIARNIPSFEDLRNRVQGAARKGYIKGLDGRKVTIRSEHAALNSLLQSAGSIVMKEALVLFNRIIKEKGLDAHFVGNIHDEWQLEVREDLAEQVGQLGVQAIEEAGKTLQLKCPLTGEYNVGINWSETH